MAVHGHGFDGVERRGLMFVLSSPSGAGKTTLSRLLIKRMPGLKMSVSVTTRAKRPGEVEGKDYLFVDKVRFEEMVKRHELLEWATVFDNRYGTPRAPVEAALSAGQDVLFDIDWQGTQQLREKARADVVSVFILPPSAADLEKRLHSRAQDTREVIRGRMQIEAWQAQESALKQALEQQAKLEEERRRTRAALERLNAYRAALPGIDSLHELQRQLET